MLDLCFADSRIFCFWQVLESIHKFITELHVLQFLFVRRSKKNKGGVKLFQISQKERLFHLSGQPSALGGNITMCPPSSTTQKRPSCPLQFGQEENMPGHSVQWRAYWFVLKIARMFPTPTSRNRMMSTLVIVNITPKCKR